MSDLEPLNPLHKKEVAPRHIPQEIVPVPIAEARDLVRDALSGTSLLNPIARYYAGWALFAPHVRFTPVDATHTRIELDVVGMVPGTDLWLFAQKRGEIDRFFVAIQDELDRREHWRALLSNDKPALEAGD